MVKVFPARELGPIYISDVLAPLNELELMPTGSVTLDNIPDYLAAGAKAFGLGGGLFKRELIEQKRWEELATTFVLFKRRVTTTDS